MDQSDFRENLWKTNPQGLVSVNLFKNWQQKMFGFHWEEQKMIQVLVDTSEEASNLDNLKSQWMVTDIAL